MTVLEEAEAQIARVRALAVETLRRADMLSGIPELALVKNAYTGTAQRILEALDKTL